jgi:CO/xanthine dehydrogenase Mo-binding subunit
MTKGGRDPGLEVTDLDPGMRPKHIGARVKRVEDRRLLTGAGAFTGDRMVPGALHVAFRCSDHPHALISGIDTAIAGAMTGVSGFHTAREFDGLIESLYATSRTRDYRSTRLYPLAHTKVSYVGEPVAAVVAESPYLADDALERIEIDYEPFEALVDLERVVLASAPLLHEEAGPTCWQPGSLRAATRSALAPVSSYPVRPKLRAAAGRRDESPVPYTISSARLSPLRKRGWNRPPWRTL